MIPQRQRETAVSSPAHADEWSLATRIGFRFAFSYLILYLSPGAVGARGPTVEISNFYQRWWQHVWQVVVPWVGTNLHIQGDFRAVNNGSGDELYDYLLILCIVVLAAVATAVWSVLDRKRQNYRALYAWTRMFMRLVVGAAMIGYGLKKLFPAQFPEPQLATLIDPFGRMSPMGLLWNFMGTSRLYSLFGGLGETLGGVLLFVPRLTCLGALISFAMVSNVLALNLGYDVPRKIYSIHLLLMCMFLLLPDLRRLVNVLVLNRTAEPVQEAPLFADKQLNRAALLFQIAFGVLVVFIAGRDAYASVVKQSIQLPPTIRGVWAVDGFVLDGVQHPPLLTDSARWQDVVFDGPDELVIVDMDARQHAYPLRFDSDGRSLTLSSADQPQWDAQLRIAELQGDRMTLEGRVDGHPVSAGLRRLDLSDQERFLLVNRGFHWVNPFPLRK